MGELRDVVEQYFKAVNASDLETVQKLLHPDELGMLSPR